MMSLFLFSVLFEMVLGAVSAQAPLYVPAPGSPLAAAGGPGNILIADINKDGKPDLVVACGKGRAVRIFRGDGRGGFGPPPIVVTLTISPGEMELGDVNGDGHLDLGLVDHDSYDVTILLGDGRYGFLPAPGSPFAASTGSRPHTHGLVFGDLNGDGSLDLVTGNSADGNVAVMLGDGKGKFVRAQGSPFAVGPNPYPLALGDINGDGRLDVIAPNSGRNRTLTVLFGDGRGAFQSAPNSKISVREGPFFVTPGDLNGDEKLDLVAAHDDSSLVTILLGDGRGNFSPAESSPLNMRQQGVFGIVLRDVNGDRRMDLAAATANSVSVYLGDGRGAFTPATGSPFPSGAGTWRLALGDINKDGKPDIATTNVESDTVTVLLSSGK
ncbi:MAG: FG-GAP repeat domain-containing protein [Acidobacteriota bacterium]